MFYNARWYDPALGRFAQADSIVPPGLQGLDRYAYVNNSPMNYVDPSGHIPEEEICKYMGICDKKDFNKKYGKDLTELLWGTETTWGDKLEWYKDGKLQVAMLVLLRIGDEFSGALWGIEGDFSGNAGSFDVLFEADRAKIETEDGNLFVSTVKKSEKYDDIENAADLPITNNNYDWEAVDYYDLPELSLALTVGGSIFLFTPPGKAATAFGVASLFIDVTDYFPNLVPPGITGEPIHYPYLRLGPISTVSSPFGFNIP